MGVAARILPPAANTSPRQTSAIRKVGPVRPRTHSPWLYAEAKLGQGQHTRVTFREGSYQVKSVSSAPVIMSTAWFGRKLAPTRGAKLL